MASLSDLANEAAKLSGEGKFAAAIDKYDKIIEMNDGIAEVWLNRGVAMFNAEDVEGAADSFQRAADLKPELTIAYSNLANALKTLGRHEEAAEAYRQAAEDDADNMKAWTNLAHELNAAGKFEDAVDAVAEGLSHAKKVHAPLHNERIFALFNLDRASDSLEDVEAILEDSPMEELTQNQRELYSMVLSQHGSQLMKDGKLDEAVSYLERACEGDSIAANLFPYGVCLVQMGKDDAGASVLEQALESDPENWRILIALGTVSLRNKDFERAAELLGNAIDLDEKPRSDPNVKFNYAVALMNLGRDEEARPLLEFVVDRDPENHVALGLLGTILIANKEYDAAVDVLEQAASLDGAREDSSIHYNLGYARLMQDKPKEALDSFKEALEINPKNKQAQAAVDSLSSVVLDSPGAREVSTDELVKVAHSRSAAPIHSESEMRSMAAKAKTPLERIQMLLGPERPEYLRRRSMEGIRAGYVLALAEVYDEMTAENLRS